MAPSTSTSTGTTPKRPEPAAIDMELKTQPLQERSRQTYEAILAAAGQLLAEVGIEQLSTNLVCKRAGLSPPALYRYFPNKYALLKELGVRLMNLQDDAVFEWIEAGGLDAGTVEESFRRSLEIQERVNEITRREPGGLWIMRAMRAVPMMRQVRIESRDRVADRVFRSLRKLYSEASDADLRIATRLSTEVCYAATEMVLEEPDADADRVTEELCWMVALYYAKFR
ncbi:MAG TPA: TetR/AcrR family transcriptional regulator [Aliidongia sp.]|nr:TetR/AcrR family transcriptional regulator [Aliidongia sp.]